MKILFLSLLDFDNIEEHNIYTDLLRRFYHEGHEIYVVSPVERRKHKNTQFLKISKRLYILKPRTGNIQKTNVIEKGISTITLETIFITAIKKYFKNIKFDLILYTTPPITLQRVVNYIKKRDHALAYLMLKDIFPQNAVDMGMLSTSGLKGILYHFFRNKEKKLYRDSDVIGCMSQANVDYVVKHNPEVNSKCVEICPNCIEPVNQTADENEKREIRRKMGIPMDQVLFVYGGNLGRPQGIPFLIECLKKAKEISWAYFFIVGDGTEYGILQKFIEDEKPENIKVMRALPKVEYERVILAADVGMIFLDYRFTIPNFPSRILSYMDAGLPVLAVTDRSTDIGRVIEEGKFGVSVTSDNTNHFLHAVEKFAASEERVAMGENARKYLAENYTVAAAYAIIMNHIKD